jgi:hypothetical protein
MEISCRATLFKPLIIQTWPVRLMPKVRVWHAQRAKTAFHVPIRRKCSLECIRYNQWRSFRINKVSKFYRKGKAKNSWENNPVEVYQDRKVRLGYKLSLRLLKCSNIRILNKMNTVDKESSRDRHLLPILLNHLQRSKESTKRIQL